MATKTVIVTGANGEIGRGIVAELSKSQDAEILALDLAFTDNVSSSAPTSSAGSSSNVKKVKADILDARELNELTKDRSITAIFHLAALLSSSGERDPERAHRVNVEGSLNLLQLARNQTESSKTPVKFIFPSTIAIYGRPAETPALNVTEDQFLLPITMYGVNKLYVEQLGRYFKHHYRLLDGERPRVDFRCVRLPGVLCSDTVPSGGTSDYGPEMVHAAAQGKSYSCFVPPTAQLPFMVKPDAVAAIVGISRAATLPTTNPVYNVTAFAPTAREIELEIRKYYPKFEVSYEPHPGRTAIVASWPQSLDDSRARADWGWKPQYDFASAFKDYLVPGISKRYSN